MKTGGLTFSHCWGDYGPLDGQPLASPYPTLTATDRKRLSARQLKTTYIYDFPDLFRVSVKNAWARAVAERREESERAAKVGGGEAAAAHVDVPPAHAQFDCVELVMGPNDTVVEVKRPEGLNTIGMVAWWVRARTPEAPAGRRFVIIGNDITHQMGSFGPQEDKLFHLVTELCIREKLPRLYVSANSGARIGIAQEVRPVFQVRWNDETDPTKGYR